MAKGTVIGESVGEVERALRPTQCREYMRRTLAREYRAIVDGFVKQAKKGSCQHVKLATELLQKPEPGKRRGKGTAVRLLEKLSRD